LTYKVTSGSLESGDSFSGALTRAPGETVGSYTITQGTLTAGGNYALTFVASTLKIVYGWDGFLQPINDTAHQTGVQQSKFKLGQTIPAKFLLKNAAGAVVRHFGIACGHRGWKWQPEGGASGDGISPLIGTNVRLTGSTLPTSLSSACVYG